MAPQAHTSPDGSHRRRGNAMALRWAGTALLAAALAAGPLLFGAVETWAWAILFAACASAALFALAAWLREYGGSIIAAPVLFLLVLLAAVAAVQVAPLPGGFFRIASEGTRAARRALGLDGGGPISLVPGATLEALAKIITVLSAVFATLALVRTRAMLYVCVAAATFAVLVSSAVGIMQEGPQQEKIYWVRALPEGQGPRPWRSFRLDPALSSGVSRLESVEGEGGAFFARSVNVGDVFGPYANSNHFGGLVEIVLPVLLALLAALLAARRGGWGEEGGFASTAEGGFSLLAIFTILLGGGAVVYAGSAGALVGMGAGFAVVLLAAAWRRGKSRGAVVFLVCLAAVVLAGAFLFRTQARERLRTKIERRWDVWEDAVRAARDFPVTGSGLGTYSYVAPRYEDTEAKYLFAHNDYLQFVLEGGLVASGIAAVLVIWQFVHLLRGAFAREDIYMSALSAGAAGSMAAVAVHSLFDFNLHVPANALVLAVMISAGSAAARARREDIESIEFRARAVLTSRTRALCGAFFGVLVLAGTAALVGACVYAGGAKGRARLALGAPGGGGSLEPARLEGLCERLSRAASLAPWDGEVRYMRARALFALAAAREDEAAAESLRAESMRAASAAFRLAPPCTHYAMTAVTLGGAGGEALERWQISCFDYKRRLAEMMFREGRFDEGLAVMREALALEGADAATAPERATAAVRAMVRRFGSYPRVREAAPDSFGGRFLFAAGLASAGLEAAAEQQYLAAAGMAGSAGREEGFNEQVCLMLASRLLSRGRSDEVTEFCTVVLEREPGWHYIRLTLARQLAREGSPQAADKEIGIILAGDASDDLKSDALELRESLDWQSREGR